MIDGATNDSGLRRSMPTFAVLGVILGMVAVLLAVTYSIGKKWEEDRHFLKNYRVPDQFELFLNMSIEYCRNSSEKNDVLILGGSSGRTGLDPQQLEDLTGLKAYNLASMGEFGMDKDLFTLRTYLEHHPKPQVVVLCVNPEELEFPPPDYIQETRSRFYWCFGDGSESTRPIHENPFEFHARQGGWILYGYATGGFERYANEPVPAFFGKSYNVFTKEIIARRGFDQLPTLHGPRKELKGTGPFVVSAYHRQQLENLALMTQEAGCLFLIRLAPISLDVPQRNFDGIEPALAELERQYPHAHVGRPVPLAYDADLCWDVAHLNSKGAAVFTTLLAQNVSDLVGKR
jgi:hypothetical protein